MDSVGARGGREQRSDGQWAGEPGERRGLEQGATLLLEKVVDEARARKLSSGSGLKGF